MATTQVREKLRIRLKAYDFRQLDVCTAEIVGTVSRSGARVLGPVQLPTQIQKWTVLRSPHVDKRSREQFEIRTHNRLIDVVEPTAATVEALMTLRLPSEVDVEIKVPRQPARQDTYQNRSLLTAKAGQGTLVPGSDHVYGRVDGVRTQYLVYSPTAARARNVHKNGQREAVDKRAIDEAATARPTMSELRGEHEVALRLQTGHSPELLLELFRDAADEPRYLSLEWSHRYTPRDTWVLAVALFAERTRDHGSSSPVHWLVHSAQGHEAGTLTTEELAAEATGSSTTLSNPRSRINHISAWCEGVLLEVDIQAAGDRKPGRATLLWKEGSLSESEIRQILERSGDFSREEAARATSKVIDYAYPKT